MDARVKPAHDEPEKCRIDRVYRCGRIAQTPRRGFYLAV